MVLDVDLSSSLGRCSSVSDCQRAAADGATGPLGRGGGFPELGGEYGPCGTQSSGALVPSGRDSAVVALVTRPSYRTGLVWFTVRFRPRVQLSTSPSTVTFICWLAFHPMLFMGLWPPTITVTGISSPLICRVA